MSEHNDLYDEMERLIRESASLRREILQTRIELHRLEYVQFVMYRYFRRKRKDPLSQLIDSGLLKLEESVARLVRWLFPNRKKK